MNLLKTIGFGMIGLPLLAMLIMGMGAQHEILTWLDINRAFLWAVGAGVVLFTTIKDARILFIVIVLVYVLATVLL